MLHDKTCTNELRNVGVIFTEIFLLSLRRFTALKQYSDEVNTVISQLLRVRAVSPECICITIKLQYIFMNPDCFRFSDRFLETIGGRYMDTLIISLLWCIFGWYIHIKFQQYWQLLWMLLAASKKSIIRKWLKVETPTIRNHFFSQFCAYWFLQTTEYSNKT